MITGAPKGASSDVDAGATIRLEREGSSVEPSTLWVVGQGIEFRAPLETSAPLRDVLARVRRQVATLGADRYMAPDLAIGQALIAGGEVQAAAGIALEIAG